jgi:hypothetical protein
VPGSAVAAPIPTAAAQGQSQRRGQDGGEERISRAGAWRRSRAGTRQKKLELQAGLHEGAWWSFPMLPPPCLLLPMHASLSCSLLLGDASPLSLSRREGTSTTRFSLYWALDMQHHHSIFFPPERTRKLLLGGLPCSKPLNPRLNVWSVC